LGPTCLCPRSLSEAPPNQHGCRGGFGQPRNRYLLTQVQLRGQLARQVHA
jgi:hypothetical protein